MTGNDSLKLLNSTLQNGLQNEFYDTLRNPNFGLSDRIDEFALPLYYEEMKVDRLESQVKLKRKKQNYHSTYGLLLI